jgi:hypothetical protein
MMEPANTTPVDSQHLLEYTQKHMMGANLDVREARREWLSRPELEAHVLSLPEAVQRLYALLPLMVTRLPRAPGQDLSYLKPLLHMTREQIYALQAAHPDTLSVDVIMMLMQLEEVVKKLFKTQQPTTTTTPSVSVPAIGKAAPRPPAPQPHPSAPPPPRSAKPSEDTAITPKSPRMKNLPRLKHSSDSSSAPSSPTNVSFDASSKPADTTRSDLVLGIQRPNKRPLDPTAPDTSSSDSSSNDDEEDVEEVPAKKPRHPGESKNLEKTLAEDGLKLHDFASQHLSSWRYNQNFCVVGGWLRKRGGRGINSLRHAVPIDEVSLELKYTYFIAARHHFFMRFSHVVPKLEYERRLAPVKTDPAKEIVEVFAISFSHGKIRDQMIVDHQITNVDVRMRVRYADGTEAKNVRWAPYYVIEAFFRRMEATINRDHRAHDRLRCPNPPVIKPAVAKPLAAKAKAVAVVVSVAHSPSPLLPPPAAAAVPRPVVAAVPRPAAAVVPRPMEQDKPTTQ